MYPTKRRHLPKANVSHALKTNHLSCLPLCWLRNKLRCRWSLAQDGPTGRSDGSQHWLVAQLYSSKWCLFFFLLLLSLSLSLCKFLVASWPYPCRLTLCTFICALSFQYFLWREAALKIQGSEPGSWIEIWSFIPHMCKTQRSPYFHGCPLACTLRQ